MIIQPYRSPWKTAFPDVVLHASESIVKQHPAYLAAKSGDTAAALVLIADTLSDVAIQQLQAMQTMQTMQIKYAMRKPILISVHAEEAMGNIFRRY
jgi:hypothetical protein